MEKEKTPDTKHSIDNHCFSSFNQFFPLKIIFFLRCPIVFSNEPNNTCSKFAKSLIFSNWNELLQRFLFCFAKKKMYSNLKS